MFDYFDGMLCYSSIMSFFDRKRTSVGQKLPAQLEYQILEFLRRMIHLRAENQYHDDRIWNADEKPVHIDSVTDVTIDVKGDS